MQSKFFTALYLVASVLWSSGAMAAIPSYGTAQVEPFLQYDRNFVDANLLKVTNVTSGIEKSNVTVTKDTSAGMKYEDIASFALTSATNPAYFRTTTMTMPKPYADSGNCQAWIFYKGDGRKWEARITDGSNNTLNTAGPLLNTTTWGPASETLTFPCAGASSYKIGVFSNDTSPGDFNVAGFVWGPATNIAQVSQAEMVGSITFAAASGCGWASSSSSFTDPAAEPSCNSPILTGRATSSGKTPTVTFPSLAPGEYEITVTSRFLKSNANVVCQFRIFDGASNTMGSTVLYNASDGAYTVATLNGHVSYSTAQTNKTFYLQPASDLSGSECTISADINDLVMTVKRFPSQSQTVVSQGYAGQSLTSWTPTGTWTTNTTYSGKYQCQNGNLDLDYYVALSGAPDAVTLELDLPPGFSIPASKISSTTPGVQAFHSTGRAIESAAPDRYIVQGAYGSNTDSSTRFIVFYALDGGSTANVSIGNGVAHTAPFTFDNGDSISLKVTIPVSECPVQNAPLLVNSVVSKFKGVTSVERFTFGGPTNNVTSSDNCSSSPCTVQADSGIVDTITRSSTGQYAVIFLAGSWSSLPTCTCTSFAVTVGETNCSFRNVSTSGIPEFSTIAAGVTPLDSQVNVICVGPK